MNKHISKILAMILTVIMLLSLTACGDKQSGPTYPAPDSPGIDPDELYVETAAPNGVIDAFADLKLNLRGNSPRIRIYNNFSDPYVINGVKVKYEIMEELPYYIRCYANGDVVTIKATIQDESGQCTLKEETKDFVIESEYYYATSSEEIPADVLAAQRELADEAVTKRVDFWATRQTPDYTDEPYTFNGVEMVGAEFWLINNDDAKSIVNNLVFYYRIDATDKDGNDTSRYIYVSIYDLVLAENDGVISLVEVGEPYLSGDNFEYSMNHTTLEDARTHCESHTDEQATMVELEIVD